MRRTQDHRLALVRLALGRRAVAAAAGLSRSRRRSIIARSASDELEVEPLEVARRVDATRRDAGAAASSNARTTWSSASASRSRARCSAGSSSVPTRPSDEAGGAGQVDVGDVGLHDLLRLEHLGEPVEPLVGHLDDADVELRAAVAAGLGVAARQRVEHGGLAGRGQADDGDLHAGDRAGRPRRRADASVSTRRRVDDVVQRLARGVAAEVLAEQLDADRSSTRAARPRRVRRDDHVGQVVERRRRRQRLLAERVEDGAAERGRRAAPAAAPARRRARRGRR